MKPSARFRKLHFVGIGGAGMSVLAEVLASWGFTVSGTDGQESETLERLRKLGMRHEGCLRQHVRRWVSFEDVEQYGILAREWREAGAGTPP